MQCTWCWRWGKCTLSEGEKWDDEGGWIPPLAHVDGYAVTLLCTACVRLEEPPYWPNNRQRCTLSLEQGRLLPQHILSLGSVTKLVADFVAKNTV